MPNGTNKPFEGAFIEPQPTTLTGPDPEEEDERLARVTEILGELNELRSPGRRVQVPGQADTFFAQQANVAGTTTGAGPFSPGSMTTSAIMGLFSAGAGLLEELGIDLGGEVEEFAGPTGRAPSEEGKVLDLTDPRVEIPEDTEIPRGVQRLRTARRLVESAGRGTLIGPALTGAQFTERGAEARGDLAEPRTQGAQVASFIGENLIGGLIPGVAAYLPAKVGMQTAMKAGRYGPTIVRGMAKKLARNPSNPIVKRLLGEGAEELSEGALRTALRERLPSILSEGGAEAFSGAAISGFFGARERLESEGELPSLKEMATYTFAGGVAGGVLGTLFRARDIRDVTRAARVMEDLATKGDIEITPGTVVNGKKAIKRADGAIGWKDTETGKFTSAPGDEDMKQHMVDFIAQNKSRFIAELDKQRFDLRQTLRDEGELSSESARQLNFIKREYRRLGIPAPEDRPEGMEQALAQLDDMRAKIKAVDDPGKVVKEEVEADIIAADEANPDEVRGIVAKMASQMQDARPQNLRDMEARAKVIAVDYLEGGTKGFGKAKQKVRNAIEKYDSVEPVVREIQSLRAIYSSPSGDISQEARVTALGRAIALRNAIVNRGRPIDGGSIDIGVERAAKKLAREDNITFEHLSSFNEAQGAIDVDDDVAPRIVRLARQLKQSGQPARDHKAVNSILQKRGVARTRGVSEGSMVMLDDGTVGKVQGDPVWEDFGFTSIKTPEGIRSVDLSNATPLAKAGNNVRMLGGKVGKVVTRDLENRTLTVELPDGSRRGIDFDEIESIGDTPAAQAQMAEQAAEQTQPNTDQMVAPIRQTEAVRRFSGERVEVVAGDEEAVMVLTRTGETKVVPKDELSIGSRQAGPQDVAKKIPVFEPGTTPAEGKNINYLVLPEQQASTFEQLYRQTGDLSQILDRGSLYLFPQPPREGTKMYAVELPSEIRSPTKAGKKALGVLGGNLSPDRVHPNTLRSRVKVDLVEASQRADDINVYEVPDGLRQQVEMPGTVNQFDDKDAKLAYLRKLTDLGFEADAETAAAKAKAQEASAAANDALRARDAGTFEVEEIRAADATAEAGQRALEQELEMIGQARQAYLDDLTSEMSEDTQALFAAVRSGDGDAVREYLKRLPARGPREMGHPAVHDHVEYPGVRLVIDKKQRQTFQRGQVSIERVFGETRGDPARTPRPFEPPTGRTEPATRDVYHIRIIGSDGSTLRDRVIGTDNTIKVPKSLTSPNRESGTSSFKPSVGREIQERLSQGERRLDIIRDLRSRQGAQQTVKLDGRKGAFEVLRGDPEGTTMTVEGPDGRRFQTDTGQITEVNEGAEDLVEVAFPARLSENEIVEEVMAEIGRNFEPVPRHYGTGELRSNIPGVYATVRPRRARLETQERPEAFTQVGDEAVRAGADVPTREELVPEGEGPFVARVWETPKDVSELRDKRSIMHMEKEFDSREAAEQWLSEQYGFSRPEGVNHNTVVERFHELPDPDNLNGTQLQQLEDMLTETMRWYDSTAKGWLPPPLRDYAIRFALRWRQLGMPVRSPQNNRIVPFNSRLRKKIGTFYAEGGELARAQGGKQTADVSVTRGGQSDIAMGGGEIELRGSTGDQLYTEQQVVDGFVLDAADIAAGPKLSKSMRETAVATKHNQRFFDTASLETSSRVDDFVPERLVRYGPEGRLGVITEPRLGRSDAQIMVPEGGEMHFLDVAKSDIVRVRDQGQAQQFVKMIRDSTGELTTLPRTREMGFGDVDQALGLDGVTSRSVYEPKFRSRVQDVLDNVHLGDDGTVQAADETREQLVNLWVRSKELGIDLTSQQRETVLTSEGKEVRKIFQKQVPSSLEGALDRLAYERIANSYSPVNPFGDIVARAKLGQLTKGEREALAEQAAEFGLGNMPEWQQAEELVERSWDPVTAKKIFQLRNDLGFARMADDGNLPPGAVTFRSPVNADVDIGPIRQLFMLPRTLAEKHPTPRTFITLQNKARMKEGKALQVGRAIGEELRARYKDTEIREIRDLLEAEELIDIMDHPHDTPTWEQVQEAVSDVPDEYEWGFNAVRALFEEDLERTIRTALRRGWQIKPMSELPAGEAERIAMKEFNLSRAEWEEATERGLDNFYMTDRSMPLADQTVLRQRTSADAVRPKDEVDEFLRLRREYAAYDEIPEEARAGLPEWIDAEEFNYWKNYGIKNYWPLVHQGKVEIHRQTADGTLERVAFAPSGLEAMNAIRKFRAEEIFPKDTQYELKMRGAYIDDIDAQYIGVKDLKKRFAEFASIAELDNEFIGQLFRKAGVRGGPKAPTPVHAKRRVGNLIPIIEDPIHEMQIYHSRVVRSEYLLDTLEAFETAMRLDEEMSAAYGLPAVKTRHGELENMHAAMKHLRDTAMGEQTKFEKRLDSIVAMGKLVTNLPGHIRKNFMKKFEDPDYDLLKDPEFRFEWYNRDYAFRNLARQQAGIQSILRLGVSAATAGVNMMQFFMNTGTKVVQRSNAFGKGGKHMVGALQDLHTYWRGTTTEAVDVPGQFFRDITRAASSGERSLPDWSIRNPLKAESKEAQELADFAEALGLAVMPQKGAAGFVGDALGSQKPMVFTDESVGAGLGKWGQYGAMWMFNKAERFNRLGTAFAARRLGKQKGLEGEELVHFARQMIDETQFQYYDFALPEAMRGPLARVLFQFKPFVVNQVKFMTDLGVDAAKGKPGALKGVLAFMGAGSALGGAAFWADHPYAMPINIASEMFTGKSLEQHVLAGPGRDHYINKPESWDNPVMKFDDVFRHGLPGALGLSISQRLGVGAQDFDPRRWQDLVLGPHYGMYYKLLDAFGVGPLGGEQSPGYLQQRGDTGLASAFGFAGGNALMRAGRMNIPGSPIAGTVLGTWASSKFTPNDFGEFLRNNRAGRQLASDITPGIVRGVQKTADIFLEGPAWAGVTRGKGELRGTGLDLTEIPPGPSRLHESAAALLNMQTVRNAEENAYVSFIRRKASTERATRSAMLTRAAQAWLDGDFQRLQEIYAASANLLDSQLTKEDVMRKMERLGEPRVEQQINRALLGQRSRLVPGMREDR